VIATAGPRSAEAVRRQGADEIVDYRVAPLPGQIDVVLHLVPGYPGDLSALLRPGGLVVSAVGPVASGVHFVARNDLGHLASLVEMVDAGALQVDVASRRPLAELAAVHREAEAGLLRGKTILDIV
jgi:NADPH:quinone reductase-like Zn-dependent oxidoreductase